MLVHAKKDALDIVDAYDNASTIKPELYSDIYRKIKPYLYDLINQKLSLDDIDTTIGMLNDLNKESKSIYTTSLSNTSVSSLQIPGYKKILRNMNESVIAEIHLVDAIKKNPDIYSEANIADLYNAGVNAKNIADAQDYIAKANEILRITELHKDGGNYFKKIEFDTKQELRTRLYKIFMDRVSTVSNKKWILIMSAETSNHHAYVEGAAKEVLFNTLIHFIENNGTITNAEQTAIVFGTPENEYKDGLLYLMEGLNFVGVKGGDGKLAQLYLNGLKALILCNNDKIIANSYGKISAFDAIYFYTQVYSVNKDENLALGKAVFASLDQNDFQQEALTTIGRLILNRVSTKTLSKGLENFNKINEIVSQK